MVTAVHIATVEHTLAMADQWFVESKSKTIQAAREQRLLDSCPPDKELFYWHMRHHGDDVVAYFYAASEWDVLDLLGIAEIMRG